MENPIEMDDLGVPLFSEPIYQVFSLLLGNYAALYLKFLNMTTWLKIFHTLTYFRVGVSFQTLHKAVQLPAFRVGGGNTK